MRRVLLVISLILAATSVVAQRHHTHFASPSMAQAIAARYADSLSRLRVYYDSTWVYDGERPLVNPYYYRLFVQPTLYYSSVDQAMGLRADSINKPSLLQPHYDQKLRVNTALNSFFASLYTTRPDLIRLTQSAIDEKQGIRQDLPSEVNRKVAITDKVTPSKPVEVYEPVQVISHRPNFWSTSQRYSLQFMQNYISSNWYKGGNSSNSFLATAYLTLNYNKNNKVIFENSLDVKLGFQTVKGDTVHKFQTTTDEIRMVNKVGLRAIKNWYYSISLQSWTQMLPKYHTNSHTIYSDFMSPFETVLSAGMEYKYSKSKLSLSANIAPLSFDLKYVAREALEKRYGNLPRHHLREYYGSNITVNYTWKILKELSWTGRIYYFTNYQKVQMEWENTFNFTINKFISSKLYLYPRFDDTQYNANREHRVQFKEWISLGFNYSL